MTTTHTAGLTTIEKMLGFEFVSDPRGAEERYPLPKPPKGHNMDYPYHVGAHEYEITPEVAKGWVMYRLIRREKTPASLLHPEFTDNRKIILSAVKSWKNKIEKDQINSRIAHGLAFTPDGFILDGQHRLMGAILAGKSIRLPIAVNTPWDTFRSTDSGTARTAAQMLGVDYPQPNASAAATRMIFAVLAGDEKFSHSVSSASREDQLDMIHSWPFFRDKSTFELLVKAHKAASVQLSHLVGVCAMAHASLTVLGDKYPGDGTFEIDHFLRGLAFKKAQDFEDWGAGNDPRFMLQKQSSFVGKAAEDQRTSISLCRRAMTLWLNRHEKQEFMTRIGPARNNTLHPVWRSDLVMEYAADRQRELSDAHLPGPRQAKIKTKG